MAEEMVEEVDETEDEGIHLYVSSETPGDPTVAVRWCICKSVLDELKEFKVENPYLLLAVCSKSKEVVRKLVPLDQMMEYITFRRPGPYQIFSAIVWVKGFESKKLEYKTLKQCFLTPDSYNRGEYESNVFQLVGYPERHELLNDFTYYYKGEDIAIYSSTGRGMVEVNVEKEFFAKEPPKWLFTWVNLFYETKPCDQCQFRRRFLFASGLQPVLSLIIILFRMVVAVVLLSCGMRGIDFRAVFDLNVATENVLSGCGYGSIFIRNRQKKLRPFFLILLMPIIPISSFLVLWFMDWFFIGQVFHKNIWLMLEAAVGGCLAVSAFFLVCRLIGLLFVFLKNKLIALQKKSWAASEEQKSAAITDVQKWTEAREKKMQKIYDTKYAPLVCTGVPVKADIEALPSTHRTFYLRYMDLKRRVCKPFAR